MKILRILLLLCFFTITSSKLFCEDLPVQNCFIKNAGQWDSTIKYFTSTGGMNCWITNSGLVFDYYQYTNTASNTFSKLPSRLNIDTNFVKTGHIVRANFVNSSTTPIFTVKDTLNCKYNYYIGGVDTNWRSGVRSFKTITMKSIWRGINVKYYYENNKLRYDYIVDKNIDPNLIKINYDYGANLDSVLSLNANGTEFSINTNVGKVLNSGLFAYQFINGAKIQVPCKFVLKNNELSFQVGEYNKDEVLIIDPLVWAGFISNASSFNDLAVGTSIDVHKADYNSRFENFAEEASGLRDIVVTGYTNSISEINKIMYSNTGSYSYQVPKDSFMIYLAEVVRNGSEIKYLTFIGSPTHSSIACEANCLYTDPTNTISSVALVGYTNATDYPVINMATWYLDSSFYHRGGSDVIISKFKNGILDKSRYLGGIDNDAGYGISYKSFDEVQITGFTTSPITDVWGTTNFPRCGYWTYAALLGRKDIFISKLDTNLNLTMSNVYGGENDDIAYDIDEGWITGTTNSNFGYGSPIYGLAPSINTGSAAFLATFWGLGNNISSLSWQFINGLGDESGYSVSYQPYISSLQSPISSSVSISGITNSNDMANYNLPNYSTIGNRNSQYSAFVYSMGNGGGPEYCRIALFDSSLATCIKSVNVYAVPKTIITGNFKNSVNINPVLEIDQNYSSTNQSQNGFILITDALNDSLVSSAYINGNSNDDICSFAVCATDEVHTLTNSYSTDLQTTSNCFQPNEQRGFHTSISKFEGMYLTVTDSIPRIIEPRNETTVINSLDSFNISFYTETFVNFAASVAHYELQISNNSTFNNPIRYKSECIPGDTTIINFKELPFKDNLTKGIKYYSRICVFNPVQTTPFSTRVCSFILVDTLAINLTTGDNWISSNIKPLSTNWKDIIGTTNINKVNNISIDGKIFTRNDINLGKAIFDSSKVYKINVSSPFKLVFKGYLIDSNTTLVNTRNNVENQPYYSKDIPYLGSIERNVEDIWALNKNGLIFKDFKGHYYIPSLGINTFTSKIAPGNAYRIISSDSSFAWQEAKYNSPSAPIISYNNKRETWSDSVYSNRYNFSAPSIPSNSNIFKLIFSNSGISDSSLVLAINRNTRNVIGFGFIFNNTAILKLPYTNDEFQFYYYNSFNSPKEIQRISNTNDTLNKIFTMGDCASCSNIFHYKNNSLFSNTGSEITIYTTIANPNSSSANTLNLLAYPNPANVGVEGKIRPVFLETSVYLKDTVLSNGSIVKILDYNTASASEPYLLSFSAYDINNPNQPMPNFFINRVDYNGVSQINDLLRTETVRFVPPYPSTYIIVCSFSRGNTVLSTSIQKILVTR